MAIQDSFNLSQATTSQAYAYKCWYNYNYGGNTMKISSKDMGEITQTWNGELSNWRATASDDENAYEIEDDDFRMAKNNGKESAKEKTGYEGGKGKMIARGTVDATLAVGNAVGTQVAKKATTKIATEMSSKALNKVTAKAGEKAASKGVEKSQEQLAKGTGKSIGCIVGCTLGLAAGVAYMAKKPNKEQKEACDELQNTMQDSQAALASAQEDMSTYSDELVDLSDQAQVYNEDANDEIEDKKSEFDMYKASYDELIEKANSGETLTEDEKALLKELAPLMQELGEGINETSEETTDAVAELYDEMGTYQDGYDNAASTMAEVEGVTDYAESFDEATRTMCYVEGAAQTLNAASSAKSSYEAFALASSGSWAFGATAWAYAFGVMGASGAAMSGVGAAQQFQWAGNVGTEIDLRKDTQELNATTTDIYDENIDIYAGQMEGVEELELDIPEDIEAPTETPEIPTENTDGTATQAQTGTQQNVATKTTNAGGVGLGATGTETTDDKKKDKGV